jgi:hypothetical protein
MLFLKLFEEFNNTDDDVLYIFDFDDTIVDSPRFEEQIKDYLSEGLSIKDLLDEVLVQINANKSDLRYENGRYFIEDPNNEIDILGKDWVRKKSRIYLNSPEKYYYSDLSFPTRVTEIGELYKKVKNKAIVTARYKKIQWKVEKYLDHFGFDYPNYGLFCFPGLNDNKLERASPWKGRTIVKLISENGFKKAIFYDDTAKTIKEVRRAVKNSLPYVDFEAIKVNGWWT